MKKIRIIFSLIFIAILIFGKYYVYSAQNEQSHGSVSGRIAMIFGFLIFSFGFYLALTSIYKAKEAMQKFDKIFKYNPSLMAISSLKTGKFTDVNNEFLEKLGFAREEIIGKKSAELDIFVQPEKQKKVAMELMEKGYIHDVDLQIKTKSKEILDGLFSGEIIETNGEKYLLTVMVDQTERKKFEKKLQEKLAEIEEVNKLMVGREIKMIELKEKINNLENKGQ